MVALRWCGETSNKGFHETARWQCPGQIGSLAVIQGPNDTPVLGISQPGVNDASRKNRKTHIAYGFRNDFDEGKTCLEYRLYLTPSLCVRPFYPYLFLSIFRALPLSILT